MSALPIDRRDPSACARLRPRASRPTCRASRSSELAREFGLDRATSSSSRRTRIRAGRARRCAPPSPPRREDSRRYPDGNGFALKDALARALRRRRRRRSCSATARNDVLELVDAGVPAAGRSRRVFAPRVRRLSARDAGARRARASRCRRATTGTICAAMRAAITPHDARACSSPIRTTRPERGSSRRRSRRSSRRAATTSLVVLDEAYNEYLEPARHAPTAPRGSAQYPNLIVSRTFSKALRARRAARRLRRHARERRGHAEPRAPAVQRQRARAGGGASRRSPMPPTSRKAARSTATGMRSSRTGSRALGARVRAVARQLPAGEGRRCRARQRGAAAAGRDRAPGGDYGLPEFLRVTVGLPAENDARSSRALARDARALTVAEARMDRQARRHRRRPDRRLVRAGAEGARAPWARSSASAAAAPISTSPSTRHDRPRVHAR